MEIEKYVIVSIETLATLPTPTAAALRACGTGWEGPEGVEIAVDFDCEYTPSRDGGWDGPDEPADVAFTVRAGNVRLTADEVAALWPDDAALHRAVLEEVEEALAGLDRDFDPCDVY
jgi:hypothetical protein